eukprot:TRINITY_DN7709_c0_g2_i1.p1 TRINITY_DN7709_c0_g2~~TRINITY_DN7709_c0_g2_i1.p1  ORF type:complete len:6333 (+),score=1108.52 TRINITY_DN7709_c0_g2_i1:1241-19000(+)
MCAPGFAPDRRQHRDAGGGLLPQPESDDWCSQQSAAGPAITGVMVCASGACDAVVRSPLLDTVVRDGGAVSLNASRVSSPDGVEFVAAVVDGTTVRNCTPADLPLHPRQLLAGGASAVCTLEPAAGPLGCRRVEAVFKAWSAAHVPADSRVTFLVDGLPPTISAVTAPDFLRCPDTAASCLKWYWNPFSQLKLQIAYADNVLPDDGLECSGVAAVTVESDGDPTVRPLAPAEGCADRGGRQWCSYTVAPPHPSGGARRTTLPDGAAANVTLRITDRVGNTAALRLSLTVDGTAPDVGPRGTDGLPSYRTAEGWVYRVPGLSSGGGGPRQRDADLPDTEPPELWAKHRAAAFVRPWSGVGAHGPAPGELPPSDNFVECAVAQKCTLGDGRFLSTSAVGADVFAGTGFDALPADSVPAAGLGIQADASDSHSGVAAVAVTVLPDQTEPTPLAPPTQPPVDSAAVWSTNTSLLGSSGDAAFHIVELTATDAAGVATKLQWGARVDGSFPQAAPDAGLLGRVGVAGAEGDKPPLPGFFTRASLTSRYGDCVPAPGGQCTAAVDGFTANASLLTVNYTDVFDDPETGDVDYAAAAAAIDGEGPVPPGRCIGGPCRLWQHRIELRVREPRLPADIFALRLTTGRCAARVEGTLRLADCGQSAPADHVGWTLLQAQHGMVVRAVDGDRGYLNRNGSYPAASDCATASQDCQWVLEESETRPGMWHVKSAGADLYLRLLAAGSDVLTLGNCSKHAAGPTHDDPLCQWDVLSWHQPPPRTLGAVGCDCGQCGGAECPLHDVSRQFCERNGADACAEGCVTDPSGRLCITASVPEPTLWHIHPPADNASVACSDCTDWARFALPPRAGNESSWQVLPDAATVPAAWQVWDAPSGSPPEVLSAMLGGAADGTEVRALVAGCNFGRQCTVRRSQVVIVDRAPPVVLPRAQYVNVDLLAVQCTSATSEESHCSHFDVLWRMRDVGSGLSEVQWTVTTASSAHVVSAGTVGSHAPPVSCTPAGALDDDCRTGWCDCTLQLEFRPSAAPGAPGLAVGEHYDVTVMATDRAGHESNATWSFVADVTPPARGTVWDGNSSGTDVDFQSGTSLCVSWSGFQDADSALTAIWLRLLSPTGEAVLPTRRVPGAPPASSAPVCADASGVLVSGNRYVAEVEAVNAAGLSTVVRSDGVVYSTEPPVPQGPATVSPGTSPFSTPRVPLRAEWPAFTAPAHAPVFRYDLSLHRTEFVAVPGAGGCTAAGGEAAYCAYEVNSTGVDERPSKCLSDCIAHDLCRGAGVDGALCRLYMPHAAAPPGDVGCFNAPQDLQPIVGRGGGGGGCWARWSDLLPAIVRRYTPAYETDCPSHNVSSPPPPALCSSRCSGVPEFSAVTTGDSVLFRATPLAPTAGAPTHGADGWSTGTVSEVHTDGTFDVTPSAGSPEPITRLPASWVRTPAGYRVECGGGHGTADADELCAAESECSALCDAEPSCGAFVSSAAGLRCMLRTRGCDSSLVHDAGRVLHKVSGDGVLEVHPSGSRITAALPQPSLHEAVHMVRVVATAANGVSAAVESALLLDPTPPRCCRGAVWTGMTHSDAHPTVQLSDGGSWLASWSTACVSVLGLYDDETGTTAAVDALDGAGHRIGSGAVVSRSDGVMDGCVHLNSISEGSLAFFRVRARNGAGDEYTAFAGPRDEASGRITPVRIDGSAPVVGPPQLLRLVNVQARITCSDGESGVRSMSVSVQTVPAALTAGRLMAEHGTGSFATHADAACGGGQVLSGAGLPDQCYIKCSNGAAHQQPLVSGSCEGNDPAFGADSPYLCANLSECRAVCNADARCHAVTTTVPGRCLMHTAGCGAAAPVTQDGSQLLLKSGVFADRANEDCSARLRVARLPEQCYHACGSTYTGECNGNAPEFSGASAELCTSAERCRELCLADPECYGVSAHSTLRRCYLLSVECVSNASLWKASTVLSSVTRVPAVADVQSGVQCLSDEMNGTALYRHALCSVRCGSSTSGACAGNVGGLGAGAFPVCLPAAECRMLCQSVPACHGIVVHTSKPWCTLRLRSCGLLSTSANHSYETLFRPPMQPAMFAQDTFPDEDVATPDADYLLPHTGPGALVSRDFELRNPGGDPFLLTATCTNAAGLKAESSAGPFVVAPIPVVYQPSVLTTSGDPTPFRPTDLLVVQSKVESHASDPPLVRVAWRSVANSTYFSVHDGGTPGDVQVAAVSLPACEDLQVRVEAVGSGGTAAAESAQFRVLRQPVLHEVALANSSTGVWNVSWNATSCGEAASEANVTVTVLLADLNVIVNATGTSVLVNVSSDVTARDIADGTEATVVVRVTDAAGQSVTKESVPATLDRSPPSGHLTWTGGAVAVAVNASVTPAIRDPHSGVSVLRLRTRRLNASGAAEVVWASPDLPFPTPDVAVDISLGGSPTPGDLFEVEADACNGAGGCAVFRTQAAVFVSSGPVVGTSLTVGSTPGTHEAFAGSRLLHVALAAHDNDTGSFTASATVVAANGSVVFGPVAVPLAPVSGTDLLSGVVDGRGAAGIQHSGDYSVSMTLTNAANVSTVTVSPVFRLWLRGAGGIVTVGKQTLPPECDAVTNGSVCPCGMLTAQWSMEPESINGTYRLAVRSLSGSALRYAVVNSTEVQNMPWSDFELTGAGGGSSADHPPGEWRLCVTPLDAGQAVEEVCSLKVGCVTLPPRAGTLFIDPVWRCDNRLTFDWRGSSSSGAPLVRKQQFRLDGGVWQDYLGPVPHFLTLAQGPHTLAGRVQTLTGEDTTPIVHFTVETSRCSAPITAVDLPLTTGPLSRHYLRSTVPVRVTVTAPAHADCSVTFSNSSSGIDTVQSFSELPCNVSALLKLSTAARELLNAGTPLWVVGRCSYVGGENCAGEGWGNASAATHMVELDQTPPQIASISVIPEDLSSNGALCGPPSGQDSALTALLGWGTPPGCPLRSADTCLSTVCYTRFSNLTVQVSGVMDEEGGSGLASVFLAASGGSNTSTPVNVVPGLNYSLSAQLTLPLDGTVSQVEACATDFSGNTACTSHGLTSADNIEVVHDSTAPEGFEMVVVEDCGDSVKLSWTGGGDTSATRVAVGAGTAEGSANVVGWQLVSALQPEVELTSLLAARALGPVYVTMVAEDSAGNTAAASKTLSSTAQAAGNGTQSPTRAPAPGGCWTGTALPPGARVVDGPGPVPADLDYLANGTKVECTWVLGATPPGLTLHWAVGTTPGGNDTVPFTLVPSASGSASAATTLSHGERYYCSVRMSLGGQSTVLHTDGAAADLVHELPYVNLGEPYQAGGYIAGEFACPAAASPVVAATTYFGFQTPPAPFSGGAVEFGVCPSALPRASPLLAVWQLTEMTSGVVHQPPVPDGKVVVFAVCCQFASGFAYVNSTLIVSDGVAPVPRGFRATAGGNTLPETDDGVIVAGSLTGLALAWQGSGESTPVDSCTVQLSLPPSPTIRVLPVSGTIFQPFFELTGVDTILDPTPSDVQLTVDVSCVSLSGVSAPPSTFTIMVHTGSPSPGTVHHARYVAQSFAPPPTLTLWWTGLNDTTVGVTRKFIGDTGVPGQWERVLSDTPPVDIEVPVWVSFAAPFVPISIEACNALGRCTTATSPWPLRFATEFQPSPGTLKPSVHCNGTGVPECVFASIGSIRFSWSSFSPDADIDRYEVDWGGTVLRVEHSTGGVFKATDGLAAVLPVADRYSVAVTAVTVLGQTSSPLKLTVVVDPAPPTGGSISGSVTSTGNGTVVLRCNWTLPTAASGLRDVVQWGITDDTRQLGGGGFTAEAATASGSAEATLVGAPGLEWHCFVTFRSRANLPHSLVSERLWHATPAELVVGDGDQLGRSQPFVPLTGGVSFNWATSGHPEGVVNGSYAVLRYDPNTRCTSGAVAPSGAAMQLLCAGGCAADNSSVECVAATASGFASDALCASPIECRAACVADPACGAVVQHRWLAVCLLAVSQASVDCAPQHDSAWRVSTSQPVASGSFAPAPVGVTSVATTKQHGAGYYLEATVCFGDGSCAAAASPGATADGEPPLPGTVVVAGAGNVRVPDCPQNGDACVPASGTLFVHWQGFSDPSGAVQQYSVELRAPGGALIAGPQNAGTDSTAAVPVPAVFGPAGDGTQLYAQVTAEDTVGQQTTVQSAVHMVETVGPVAPAGAEARLSLTLEGASRLSWWAAGGVPIFAAHDRPSGVRTQACVTTHTAGTSASPCSCAGSEWQLLAPVVDAAQVASADVPTPPGLRPGDSVLSCVRGISGTGLVSLPVVAPAVVFDTTPPLLTPPRVQRWNPGREAVVHIEAVSDPQSGVSECQLTAPVLTGGSAEIIDGCVGLSPGGACIVSAPGNVTVRLPSKPAVSATIARLQCWNGAGQPATQDSGVMDWDGGDPLFGVHSPTDSQRCADAPLTAAWPQCSARSGVAYYEVALDKERPATTAAPLPILVTAAPSAAPGLPGSPGAAPTLSPTGLEGWANRTHHLNDGWSRIGQFVYAGTDLSHTLGGASELTSGVPHRFVVRCWSAAGRSSLFYGTPFFVTSTLPGVPAAIADGAARSGPSQPEEGIFFPSCTCGGCSTNATDGFIRAVSIPSSQPSAQHRCAQECLNQPGCVRTSLNASGCSLYSKATQLERSESPSATSCWAAAPACATTTTLPCRNDHAFDIVQQFDSSVVRAHWARPFTNVRTLEACAGSSAECDVAPWRQLHTGAQRVSFFNLSLAEGSTHHVRVRSCSTCGRCLTLTSNGVLVTSARPPVPAVYPGPAPADVGLRPPVKRTAPSPNVTMHWGGDSEAAVCDWRVGRHPGGGEHMDWTPISCLGGTNSKALVLPEGTRYHHSVMVCSAAGLCTVGSSSLVVVSSSAAVVEDVSSALLGAEVDTVRPGAVWGARWWGLTELHPAAVLRYEWGLVTSNTGPTGPVSCTPVGDGFECSSSLPGWQIVCPGGGIGPAQSTTDQSFTLGQACTSLLQEGVLYRSLVRAVFDDGVSYTVFSDGAQIVSAAPPTPTNVLLPPLVTSLGGVELSWGDADVSVVTYRVRLLSSAGSVVDGSGPPADADGWVGAALRTRHVFVRLRPGTPQPAAPYFEGTTLQGEVEACNEAGLCSYASSPVVAVHLLPPRPPVVWDGAGSDLDTVLAPAVLSLSFQPCRFDLTPGRDAGLTHDWCIGTSKGGCDASGGWHSAGSSTTVVAASVPAKLHQTYWAAVRCSAGDFEEWSSSDGVTVISSTAAPPCLTVHHGLAAGESTRYLATSDRLSAHWVVEPGAFSGAAVMAYSVEVRTADGLSIVSSRVEVGKAQHAELTGLQMEHAVGYRLHVLAHSVDGDWCESAPAEPVVVDLTPPIPMEGNVPPVAASEAAALLTVSAPASDPESGVVSVEVAVGTTKGGTQVAGYKSAPAAGTFAVAAASGVTNYVTVVARNGAGGTSMSQFEFAADFDPPIVSIDVQPTLAAGRLEGAKLTWSVSHGGDVEANVTLESSGGTVLAELLSVSTTGSEVVAVSATASQLLRGRIRARDGAGHVAVGTSGWSARATVPLCSAPAVVVGGQLREPGADGVVHLEAGVTAALLWGPSVSAGSVGIEQVNLTVTDASGRVTFSTLLDDASLCDDPHPFSEEGWRRVTLSAVSKHGGRCTPVSRVVVWDKPHAVANLTLSAPTVCGGPVVAAAPGGTLTADWELSGGAGVSRVSLLVGGLAGSGSEVAVWEGDAARAARRQHSFTMPTGFDVGSKVWVTVLAVLASGAAATQSAAVSAVAAEPDTSDFGASVQPVWTAGPLTVQWSGDGLCGVRVAVAAAPDACGSASGTVATSPPATLPLPAAGDWFACVTPLGSVQEAATVTYPFTVRSQPLPPPPAEASVCSDGSAQLSVRQPGFDAAALPYAVAVELDGVPHSTTTASAPVDAQVRLGPVPLQGVEVLRLRAFASAQWSVPEVVIDFNLTEAFADADCAWRASQ